MQLIQTIVVGSGGAATVEFTSIPQDADELVLITSYRTSSSTETGTMTVNNDTGSNYYYEEFIETSASNPASYQTSARILMAPSTATTYCFGNGEFVFPNYTYSAGTKAFFNYQTIDTNGSVLAYSYPSFYSYEYLGTNAITSIQLNGSFIQDSTFSLYKIKKA